MSLKINSQDIVRQIEAKLSKIRYGTITLVIHDSKIVRIEATEKIRFDPTPIEQSKEGVINSQLDDTHTVSLD